MAIVGTTLTAYKVQLSFNTRTEIRPGPVVIGSAIAYNTGPTLVFVQVHQGLTNDPLFSIPVAAGGFTIIDVSHLGGTGISGANLYLGLSVSMLIYNPPPAGASVQVQLMMH
jgi:hypothetical protein